MFKDQAKEKARYEVYRELAETLTREGRYWDTADTRREFTLQQVDTILGLRDLEKSGALKAKLGNLHPYIGIGTGGYSVKIGINSNEWNSPDTILVHHGISLFKLGNIEVAGSFRESAGNKPVRDFVSAVQQKLHEPALAS